MEDAFPFVFSDSIPILIVQESGIVSKEKLGTNTRIWGILDDGDRRSERLEEGRKAGLQCKSLACLIFYFCRADSRGVGLGMAMVDLILWTLTIDPCFHLILEWG
jgi:hypothetical protein